MKPLREGGTDWDTAVEFRRKMYLFVTKLGRKLELYVKKASILYLFSALAQPWRLHQAHI